MEATSAGGPELTALLDAVRGRRRSGRLRTAGVAFLVSVWSTGAVAFAAASLLPSLWPSAADWPVGWVPVATGAAVGAAGLLWALRRDSDLGLARELDRRFALEDATATALAVARGELEGPLTELVVAHAESTAARVRRHVPETFPIRLPRRVARPALILAVVGLLLLLGTVPLRRSLAPSGGGVAGEVGAAVASEGARTNEELAGPPGTHHGDGDGPPEARAPNAADDPSDVSTPAESEPPPEPEEPDDLPVGPPAAVRLVMSRSVYRPEEPVVSVVTATPTGELQAPETFRVVLLLDDEPFDPREELALAPDVPEGNALLLDLSRRPSLEDRLGPGRHTLAASLADADGTVVARSEPDEFEIRGDDDGDGGPEPQDDAGGEEPPPTPPPPGAGDSSPPPQAGNEPGAPPEGLPPPPPPPDDVAFEQRAVVPLFGDEEEVKKEGLRLVIRPSGGLPDPLRREPLREVLSEARWRAEEAVDRGRVREADRELVRRYFERLERLRR